MNYFKGLIFIIFFSCTFSAFAKIIEVIELSDIKQEMSNLGKNDLVAFDVMNVLFVPKDLILQNSHKNDYKAITAELKEKIGLKKFSFLESVIIADSKQILFDETVPELIKSLQKNDVKVIALTSSITGKFGRVKNREDLRIKTLKELDIDFTGSFPGLMPITLISKVDGNPYPPKFQDGVIFTSGLEKGLILESFLSKVNFIPKKIVFIDNKLRKIQTVEAYCQKNGIEFLGIHFTKTYQKSVDSYNKNVALKQFKVLQSKKIWLSDSEAKCLVEKQGSYKFCVKK
jgi:hypothetical protein